MQALHKSLLASCLLMYHWPRKPCPESMWQGTTQGKHGGGHQWNSRPQNASQDVCPTDCPSQVTASSCVPSTHLPLEAPALQVALERGAQARRERTRISFHTEFSFCSITYVALFQEAPGRAPTSKITPLASISPL